MATHSSILAWKIPWTEEPGGPQSLGLQRVRHEHSQTRESRLPCTEPVHRAHPMFYLECFSRRKPPASLPYFTQISDQMSPLCDIPRVPWLPSVTSHLIPDSHTPSYLPSFLSVSCIIICPPIYFSIYLSRVFSPLKNQLRQGSLLSFIFTAASSAPRTLSGTQQDAQ